MEKAAAELRIYSWAMSMLERELESDFALIRRVRCASVMATCEILSELPEPARRELLFTSLRIFHPEAARVLGETPSQEQRHDFDQLRQQHLDRATEILYRARELSLDKRMLRKVATRALKDVFGEPTGMAGRAHIWYEKPYGAWTVRTAFDFAPHPSYRHQVIDASRVPILSPISLLPLVGFFSETVWDAAIRGEEEETALAMRDLSGIFLEVADDLLG